MTPGVQKLTTRQNAQVHTTAALNGRLNLTLVRANVRAILFLSIAFQDHLK